MVDDPPEYMDRSIAGGAKLVKEVSPMDWGHDVGYVSDADGHILAFAKAT